MALHKYLVDTYETYTYDISNNDTEFYIINIYYKKKLLLICRGVALGNYKNNLWAWINVSVFVNKNIRDYVQNLRDQKNTDFTSKNFNNIDMPTLVENMTDFGCVIYPKNKKIVAFKIIDILVSNINIKYTII